MRAGSVEVMPIARQPDSTDLTDAQWTRITPLIPPALPGDRPRSVDLREVINAIR